jgi:hypothetical protein
VKCFERVEVEDLVAAVGRMIGAVREEKGAGGA